MATHNPLISGLVLLALGFSLGAAPPPERVAQLRAADAAMEAKDYAAAVAGYRAVVTAGPADDNAPEVQAHLVKAARELGDIGTLLPEVDWLVSMAAPDSDWAAATHPSQERIAAVRTLAEREVRVTAATLQLSGRKLQAGPAASERFLAAERVYVHYVREFPNSRWIGEMRYGFAELLYKEKKFDLAYEQYMAVVSLDAAGPHAEFCAESAIFAASEVVKSEEKAGVLQAPRGVDTVARPLSVWQTRLLAALDQFAALYPGNPKRQNVLYKAGHLLYSENRFVEASERFRMVITLNPTAKSAEQAAHLVLDGLVVQQEWAAARAAAAEFAANPNLGSPSFRAEMAETLRRLDQKLADPAPR